MGVRNKLENFVAGNLAYKQVRKLEIALMIYVSLVSLLMDLLKIREF
ncbi:hypothetical protein ACWYRQ_11395 [Clostridioides difficile]